MTPVGSWPVDRIAVIGCGRRRKSRLARAIGITLGTTPYTWIACATDRKPLRYPRALE
jgi:hypothetical protein